MTSDWTALVAARWVHLVGGAGLFGMSLFALYAPQDVRRLYAGNRAIAMMLTALAVAASVSTFAWAVVTLVSMTGDGLAGALDIAAWRAFIADTTFGPAWAIGATLALLGVVVAAYAVDSGRFALLAGVSALLLISHAWLGHAAGIEGPAGWAVRLAYAMHVLGAGVWFGGLLSLVVVLRLSRQTFHLHNLLERFSSVGLYAVVAIVTGGAANAIAHAPSASVVLFSAWGQALAAKVALVLLMLALACLNRFVLMRRLHVEQDSGKKALIRSVLAETALGFCVLAVTAALGVLDPAS